MTEFLIFVGIILAIALVVEFWPLLLTLGILALVVFIVKKVAEKEAAREAEAQRIWEETRKERARKEAEEKQRLEQERERLTAKLKLMLESSHLNYSGIKNFIRQAPQTQKSHLVALIDSKRKSIFDLALIDISEANFSGAIDKLELLDLAYPRNQEYTKALSVAKTSLEIVNSTKNYIMSEEYGKVKQEVLERIEKETIEENRNAIYGRGLLYPLWFFAIKKPFEKDSYLQAISTLKRVKPNYFAVPVDVLLAQVYLETHCGEAVAQSMLINYKSLVDKYINEADKWALIDLASAFAWIGNRGMEYKCLQRIMKYSQVPDYIKDRYIQLNHTVRVNIKEK